jgi:hypothetical protein
MLSYYNDIEKTGATARVKQSSYHIVPTKNRVL